MHKYFKSALFIILINTIWATAAHAGSATSGGGGTHTCLNPDGTVKSTELYDLYEGREARGYTLIDPRGKSANELLNMAMKKIYEASPYIAGSLLSHLEFYIKNKTIKYDKQLAVINDANIVFFDKGCQYQQIAQWRDEYGKVFIDGNLNNEFKKSPLNVAALVLHEAVYAFTRKPSDYFPQQSNSDLARKIIAQLFSSNMLEFSDKRLFPNGFHYLRIGMNTQLIIRLTSFKNKTKFYVQGFGYDGCNSDPNHSCSYPLQLINGSLYPRFDLLTKSSYSGKVEILENGIPIYAKNIDTNDQKYIISEPIRLSAPYEDVHEQYIMSLKL